MILVARRNFPFSLWKAHTRDLITTAHISLSLSLWCWCTYFTWMMAVSVKAADHKTTESYENDHDEILSLFHPKYMGAYRQFNEWSFQLSHPRSIVMPFFYHTIRATNYISTQDALYWLFHFRWSVIVFFWYIQSHIYCFLCCLVEVVVGIVMLLDCTCSYKYRNISRGHGGHNVLYVNLSCSVLLLESCIFTKKADFVIKACPR